MIMCVIKVAFKNYRHSDGFVMWPNMDQKLPQVHLVYITKGIITPFQYLKWKELS
jgi:hypothetical protein